MKYILLIVTFLAVFPVKAETIDGADKDAFCSAIDLLAGLAMYHRLNGVTLADALSNAKRGGESKTSKYYPSIIIDAYEHPAYRTEDMKQRAENEFRNKWLLHCLKEM